MTTQIPVTTVNGLYKLTELSALSATDTTDYAAAIKGADDRSFFIVDNSEGSADVSVSLTPGNYSGGAAIAIGSVEGGKTALLYVDSAFSKTDEGIALSISPAGVGTKISAVEFLPVTNN